MITNFEQITEKLSEEEYRLIPQLLRGFERRGKNNPIKAPQIVKAINAANPTLKQKFTEVKLRKLCNFIRSNGMIGLIATSEGYYSTRDVAEIKKQIQSLKERADAIMRCVHGLNKVIERIEKQQTDFNSGY
jgi:hypothetical protein